MRKRQLLIFLFLFFLFSGLILPNYNSALGNGWPHAPGVEEGGGFDSWLNILGSWAKGLASAIIGAVAVVLILITGIFLEISQTLLNLVTSPTFINIKFTDNVFVDAGWGITRGLTNIFIVLGLVAIALATILRISSYQMKKTLPLLLIVALLINFTPMLCGLVIDASNIIMKYFLEGGTLLSEGFWKLMGTEISHLFDLKDVSETLGRGLLYIGFNVVAGLIFLLFAFLFLFRYVALWMLVILSPLALFCYIFPATKKIWDQWLNQFIQWSFIGIPAAFTLYLASMMTITLIEGGAIEGVKGFAEILGYAVPLAFLVIGFLASLQTGAMGAGLAITGSKWAGAAAGGLMTGAAIGVGAGVIGAGRGVKEGKGFRGRIKGFGKGAFTREGREKGRETVGKALEKMHVVRPGWYEEKRRERMGLDKEVKRLDKLPTDRLREIERRTAITTSDVAAKIASFEVLSKRRELEETDKRMIPLAMTHGADMGETLKARPDWAKEIGKEIKKQVESRSPKQFREETQAEALKDVEVFLSMEMAKLKDIGIRGTLEQKKAIGEVYSANKDKILQRIEDYEKRHEEREVNRITNLVDALEKDANFPI